MILLRAKPFLEAFYPELETRVKNFKKKSGRVPKLVVVLVGEDPASVIYTSQKGKVATQLGMDHETLRFAGNVSPKEVRERIQKLNEDPSVDGILVQRPLPQSFKEEELIYWISPQKDVDAFHPENVGKVLLGLPAFAPCTPAGIMKLLEHYKIPVAGKVAAVIGRSSIVGKPMAALLTQAHATVIHCHSRTPNIRDLTRQADVVIVAAGKPRLVGKDWLKPGAVVVDVGIHRTAEGTVVGDVQFDAVSNEVKAISPVPGGVGPLTIACLMENTLLSAERSLKTK